MLRRPAIVEAEHRPAERLRKPRAHGLVWLRARVVERPAAPMHVHKQRRPRPLRRVAVDRAANPLARQVVGGGSSAQPGALPAS